MTDPPTVVVLGGTGFFGRYLVEDLLARTAAHIVVASRRPEVVADPSRVKARVCDVSDASSTRKAIAGADIVVHCAGPFQELRNEIATLRQQFGTRG